MNDVCAYVLMEKKKQNISGVTGVSLQDVQYNKPH